MKLSGSSIALLPVALQGVAGVSQLHRLETGTKIESSQKLKGNEQKVSLLAFPLLISEDVWVCYFRSNRNAFGKFAGDCSSLGQQKELKLLLQTPPGVHDFQAKFPGQSFCFPYASTA